MADLANLRLIWARAGRPGRVRHCRIAAGAAAGTDRRTRGGSEAADGGRSQASLGVLVLSRPGKPVQRYHLTKPVISVGRSEGMILRIPSAEISRKHCVLTFKAGFWQVQDQGSSNGTFVNGTRVGAITQVNPGSKFRVGKVEFVLQYTLQADAARVIEAIRASA